MKEKGKRRKNTGESGMREGREREEGRKRRKIAEGEEGERQGELGTKREGKGTVWFEGRKVSANGRRELKQNDRGRRMGEGG